MKYFNRIFPIDYLLVERLKSSENDPPLLEVIRLKISLKTRIRLKY
jgi:hypothetical protein